MLLFLHELVFFFVSAFMCLKILCVLNPLFAQVKKAKISENSSWSLYCCAGAQLRLLVFYKKVLLIEIKRSSLFCCACCAVCEANFYLARSGSTTIPSQQEIALFLQLLKEFRDFCDNLV